MMDRSIPWIGLAMRLDSLEQLPEYTLPEDYSWRFFRPGDEVAWAKIETSAGEFPDTAAALAGFRKYYPSDEGLEERMLFLTDAGVPFATATAWYGDEDGPRGEMGRLHWVGIDAGHQQRRLSYPLVSMTMRVMQALGHARAMLTTQTNSWPAIKVYRKFGFTPLIRETKELEGWRIVSEKTGVDFLKHV